MHFDGVLRQVQLLGDVAVRLALCEKLQHLPLPWRELKLRFSLGCSGDLRLAAAERPLAGNVTEVARTFACLFGRPVNAAPGAASSLAITFPPPQAGKI
jgi:hypothetical protein